MKKAVAFMPIRLNSQRIINKSIVDVLGRPMFCWSLESLDKLGIPVYVYTNEEKRLREVLDFETQNVVFLQRPEKLDDHDTKGIDIYKSFADQVKSEVYLLAHCTSPFVETRTYQRVLNAILKEGYDSSCTVERKQTFCWHNGEKLNFTTPRPKTQEIEPVFVETSAAYCYKASVLKEESRSSENHALVESSGMENLDIDNPEDLQVLDFPKQGKKS